MKTIKSWLVLVLGFMAVATHAQTQTQVQPQGWHISLEMMALKVAGNDSHVGDIFTVRSDLKEKSGASRVDYGVDHVPLVVQPEVDVGLMISTGYRKGQWGVSLQGWGAEVGGALNGRVTSPDFAMTETSQNIVGVQLWGQSLPPVRNENEKSGFSPVSYHASDSLDVKKLDFLLERTLVNTPNFQFGLQAGVSAGRLINSRAEGQKQTASVEVESKRADYDPETFEPIPGTEKQVKINFDNEIQIESSSTSRMTMVGPTFGMVGKYKFSRLERLELNWQATGSLLLGQTQEEGVFIDIDDSYEVERIDGVITSETMYLHGVAKTSRKALDMIPVLELRAGASYRVSNHVNVGVGVFASTWLGVTMSPSWNVPGQWQATGGTNWKANTRNPTFLGARMFAEVKF